MNSKVGIQTNKAKLDVYSDKAWITSSISMCPWPASPGPYLLVARSGGSGRVQYKLHMSVYIMIPIFDYNYTSASLWAYVPMGFYPKRHQGYQRRGP
jgi:hypothetical protein